MTDLIFISALVATVVWGLARPARGSQGDRWGRVIVCLAATTVFGLALWQILNAPFWDRNASRLVGIFALSHGLPIYDGLDHAPLLSINYPPLSALAFAPALLLREPTAAICLATALNVLYFFAPFVFLFSTSDASAPARSRVLILCLLFFAVDESAALRYSAFRLHADAPALGLALGSVVCLARAIASRRAAGLVFSALLAILAVWTKQNLVPLLLALPVPLLFLGGRRQLLIFLGGLAGWGLASIAVAALFMDLRAMTQHLLFLGLIPMPPNKVDAFLSASAETVHGSMVWLVPAILLFVYVVRQCSTDRPWREMIGTNEVLRPALILFWVGVAMLPMSIASRMKLGGDVNSLSFTLYFWAAAGAVSAWYFLSRAPDQGLRRATTHVATAMTALFLVIHVPSLVVHRFSSVTARLETNPQREAFLRIREYPGRIYFPWNPLSHLMAEGRLYHFDPAVLDWYLAKRPLTREQYEAFIPPNLEIVAFHKENDFSEWITPRMIPGLHPVQSPAELSNWVVYRRP